MISKPGFKVKSSANKQNNHTRCSTDYTYFKKSAHIKNKLTKGCNNYEQLKDAYMKIGDNQIKTQYKEYTFQPKISTTKNHSRSFKKFIEDQQNFQQNKQSKIKQFKAQATKIEASQCSNLPQIDRISKRICTLMNYDKQQVVDRLYKKKIIEQWQDDEELFSPKILPRSKSLKRNQNVSELLHSDALRRKAKKQVQQAQKLLPIPIQTTTNKNTNQLVCNKMYMQFCEIISEEESTLPLVMVWTVLSQMFGLQLNPNKSGRQGKMCQDISTFLCQNGQQSVTRQKVWEFIQIVIKKQEAKPKFLTSESSQIIEQFGNLYTYRMAKPKTQRDGEQYPFFPQTLRSSEGKAQLYRQKLLDQAKQFLQNSHSKIKLKQQVTIEDIFLIDHMMKQASNQKKKLQKQEKQMQQCTFKPRLSESYRKPLYMPPRSGLSTCKIADSKKTLFKSTFSGNANTSTNQSLMTQSLKQLDLKVKIVKNKKPYQQDKNKSIKQIKNVDKSIMRMAIARKERELSNQIKNRGYTKNVLNWVEYARNEKNEIVNQHKKLKGLAYKKVILR